jgi:hypothetical protein
MEWNIPERSCGAMLLAKGLFFCNKRIIRVVTRVNYPVEVRNFILLTVRLHESVTTAVSRGELQVRKLTSRKPIRFTRAL